MLGVDKMAYPYEVVRQELDNLLEKWKKEGYTPFYVVSTIKQWAKEKYDETPLTTKDLKDLFPPSYPKPEG